MRSRFGLALSWWLLLSPLLVPGAALAQSSEEEAGDVSEVDKDALGPLKDRIRPVSGQVFLKRFRFEASPALTLSLKDTFFTKYMFGLALTFHLAESFAIGVRGSYSIPTVSGAAQVCVPTTATTARGCSPPQASLLLGSAPGAIRLVAGGELQWAPIYGKISLVSQAFLHFDMYAILGVAAIQYTGPSNAALFTVGGNLGVGARFYINRWLAVRTELRDLSYVEKVTLGAGTSWRNQLVFDLGFSMFLPTDFEEG